MAESPGAPLSPPRLRRVALHPAWLRQKAGSVFKMSLAPPGEITAAGGRKFDTVAGS